MNFTEALPPMEDSCVLKWLA